MYQGHLRCHCILKISSSQNKIISIVWSIGSTREITQYVMTLAVYFFIKCEFLLQIQSYFITIYQKQKMYFVTFIKLAILFKNTKKERHLYHLLLHKSVNIRMSVCSRVMQMKVVVSR